VIRAEEPNRSVDPWNTLLRVRQRLEITVHGRLTAGAALALFLFLACLLLAGCGSGGSTTTTESSTSISKSEFVAKGNAVCAAGDRTQEAKVEAFLRAQGLKANEEPTKAQLVEVTEAVFVPSVQNQIDGLTALGAPSGEEQRVNSALTGAQEAIDKIRANPQMAFAKEPPFHAAAQELHALGLTKCAPNG
jgi:hypothetical protein